MARRIREREQYSIKKFDTGFNFLKQRCCIDKVELSFDIAELEENDNQSLEEDFRHIARHSELLRYDSRRNNKGFAVRKKRNRSIPNRGTDTKPFEPFLFGGIIKKDTGLDRTLLRAFIEINPTRYFTYNEEGRVNPDADVEWDDINEDDRLYTLRKDSCVRDHILSQSINNDNFIEDMRLREANELNWINYTIDYALLCADRIKQEIQNRTNNSNLYTFRSGLKNWTIQRVEYYWEFETKENDAVFVVKEFCEHLKRSSKKFNQTIHSAGEEKETNRAHSFIFGTSNKNLDIAIYAKAENRIRIECRYKKNPKSSFNEIKNNNYNRSSRRDLNLLLVDLRQIAIERLSKVEQAKTEFNLDNIYMPSQKAITLSHFHSITKGNTAHMRQIIEACMSNASIVENPSKKAFKSVLRQLASKDINILKTIKKTEPREYIVKEPLHSMFKKKCNN